MTLTFPYFSEEFWEFRSDTPAKGCPAQIEIGTFKVSVGTAWKSSLSGIITLHEQPA